MLSRWVTFTVLLAASASPDTTVTVAPTSRVKGHPEEELTLNCGDGNTAGVVQYWRTPFGELQDPGFHSQLDPVFIQPDGSLVVPNSSRLHSGLYYCLLQDKWGTTLWPYRVHIHQDHRNHEQDGGRAGSRVRRDVGSGDGQRSGVSEQELAAAVAASVLLTFVVGFSTGALSRTHVLRCLGTIRMRMRSLRKQPDQTDSAGVTMTTLPPMYGDHEAYEADRVWDDGAVDGETMDTTTSSTTSSPPAKPQRSFRHKREEEKEKETAAYMEGCDHVKVDEEGKGLEEKNQEEETKFGGLYLLGEDEESQTDTGEEEEEEDRREEMEEKEEHRQEKVEEEVGEDEEKEEGEKNRSEEDESPDSEQELSSRERGDDESDDELKEEDETAEVASGGEPSPERRRSRVIRLYQYDEDGQRYCHLPDPAPDEPGPAPRLRQRSLSLTRLNAIMAAASAGPLDPGGDTGRREDRAHFHMDI